MVAASFSTILSFVLYKDVIMLQLFPPKGNSLRFNSHFRLVGYGLLVLALGDLIYILVPPQFMNPIWEFQTIGTLVERVPVPLLGLLLVFSSSSKSRKKWELAMLKFLAWISLIIGILFLLLIPLLIVDSLRLNNQIDQQINSQLTEQLTKLQQLEKQVGNSSDKDMNAILTRLNQGDLVNSGNTQQKKTKLLSEIQKSRSAVESKFEAVGTEQRFGLLKKFTKWSLGVLIAGVLFIYMAVR